MIKCNYHFGDETQPLLAFAIHNGHRMPEELLPLTGVDEAGRLQEEDPLTGKFAGRFANNIIVHTSRFALDLNRSPEKAIYLQPEDAWGLPVRTQELPEQLLHDMQISYQEWYCLVKYQITRMLSRHKLLIVLDLHSYNHRRGGPEAPPDPQVMNPDIILGRSNMPEQYYDLVENLRERLDGKDFLGELLDCRCDVKFSGGYFPRWLHNTFPGRVLCIAVEFKKIFMNEWTGRHNPAALMILSEIFTEQVQKWLKTVFPD
ncbi:MAG TPA: N-formylglutamate amidohydrolase [Candidatus Cloacimonadota bacterium]|nr:N-formylglutamate amidohydrolase [Candidatus Cloacimonadota bacterium]